MSDFEFSLSGAEGVMMEPLSFYSFSAISIFGSLGLTVFNCLCAPDARAMRSSKVVRSFLVPISNAGLSAGAIIAGMMFGLALGLSFWMAKDQVKDLVFTLLGMVGYVLAVLVPLVILQRSMFDVTKEDERKSTLLCAIYSIAMLFLFWHIDEEKFFALLLVMVVVAGVVIYLARRIKNNVT